VLARWQLHRGFLHDGLVRVLIADDQPRFRRAARAALRLCPEFEVVAEAGSGDEAVALAASLEPDLAIVDINMPGLSGIEATRQMTQARPAIVAVLVSTYELNDLPADARSCGAIAYMHKEDFDGQALMALYERGGDPDWRRD